MRYFYDAHLTSLNPSDREATAPDKRDYIERRPLWEAFERANQRGVPQLLLIDEIDKAPRDFPNDLLLELDQMEFTISETGERISAPRHLSPMVIITSNSERRLPEPFLRRCVYHHIQFDDDLIEQAVFNRRAEYASLSEDFLRMAIGRFLSLRQESLRKKPATSELLVWLRILEMTIGSDESRLRTDLGQLPYLGVLLKDRQDIEGLRR